MSQRPNQCSDQEIAKRCIKTKEICILMDYMFVLAQTPSSDANKSAIETTKKYVEAVLTK